MKRIINNFCKIAYILKLAKLNDKQFNDILHYRAYILDSYFPELVNIFDKSMPDKSLEQINFDIANVMDNLKESGEFVSPWRSEPELRQPSSDKEISSFIKTEATDDLSFIFMELFIDFYNDNYVASKYIGKSLLSVAASEEVTKTTPAKNAPMDFQYIEFDPSKFIPSPVNEISKENISRKRNKLKVVPLDITDSMAGILDSYMNLINVDHNLVKSFISEYRSIKNSLTNVVSEDEEFGGVVSKKIDYTVDKTFNKALSLFHKIYEKVYGSRIQTSKTIGTEFETAKIILQNLQTAKNIRMSDSFDVVYNFVEIYKANRSNKWVSAQQLDDAFKYFVDNKVTDKETMLSYIKSLNDNESIDVDLSDI